MPSTTETLIVDIQAKNEDKVKSIKSQIREATEQAAQLANKYGEFDARTRDAIRHLAQLKDIQGDINDRVKALSPDRFERIANIGQGLVGGFQTFSGIMALVGDQSKDWEKTMIKLQALVNISQGLQSFKQLKEQMQLLGGGISSTLINSFKSVAGAARAIGAALGIGLILTAVTVIAAYWDDIKAAVSGVADETRRAADAAESKAAASKEELEALSLQENILKLQGLSEREILQLKIAKTQQAIQDAQVSLKAQAEIARAQIEADARNKRFLSGILKFITAPLQLIIDMVTKVLKAVGQDFDFNIGEKIAGLIFDPEATKAEAEKAQREAERGLQELKNMQAGFQLQIQAIDKQAYDKRLDLQKKSQQEQLDEMKKWQEQVKKEKEDFLKSVEDIEGAFEAARTGAAQRENEAEKDDIKKKQEFFKQDLSQRLALKEYEKQKEKEAAEYKSMLRQMELDGATSLLSNISQLLGQNTVAGKIAALAEVGISEGRALAQALANASAPTPDNVASGGLAGVAKFLTIAASITAVALKARNIIKGGSNGGGGNFNAPAQSNTQSIQTFNSRQLGSGTQSGTAGAYGGQPVLVVEDYNSVNRRLRRTQSIASME